MLKTKSTVCESVAMGESLIGHIGTNENVGYIATKVLYGQKRRYMVSQLLYDIYDDNWNEATFLFSFSNLILGCWLYHKGLRGLRTLTAGASLCWCGGKCCVHIENPRWATAGWDKEDALFDSRFAHNLNYSKTKQRNTQRSQQNGRGLIILTIPDCCFWPACPCQRCCPLCHNEGLRGLRKLTAGACLCWCGGKCCAHIENPRWAMAGWDKADASFDSRFVYNLNYPKTKQWNTECSQQNGCGLIIGHKAVKLSPSPC